MAGNQTNPATAAATTGQLTPEVLPTTTPNPHWRVWRTASALDENGSSSLLVDIEPDTFSSSPFTYRVLAKDAARILRCWGMQLVAATSPDSNIKNETCSKKSKSISSNQSLLNKPSLLHEVEESLVALRALLEWLQRYDGENKAYDEKKKQVESENIGVDNTNDEKITIVDLCCGKGVFSMLVSYFASLPSPSICGPLLRRYVKHIVMIDRIAPPNVNWSHIDTANAQVHASRTEGCIESVDTITAAVPIETWGGCNIHDESFPNKLRSIPGKLAVVGIHLCRHLGPRSVGLFNSLGKEKSPFFCMAPCCLPRLARKRNGNNDNSNKKKKDQIISIDLYETDSERLKREEAIKLRKQALGSDKKGLCYLCSSPSHRVKDCPTLPLNDEKERIRILAEAKKMTPCWKCGVVGHQRADCPSKQTSSKPTLILQPSMEIDVSKVLDAKEPFGAYCQLLADAVQDCRGESEVRETSLVSDSSSHQEGNWNAARKSKFIIAAR